jgi:hypothetical protein
MIGMQWPSPPRLRRTLRSSIRNGLQKRRYPTKLAQPVSYFLVSVTLALACSSVSLRTKVSVAGKRNFQGRDKEAETASKVQGRRCRDKVSLNNPANSGLVSEN